MVKENSIYIIDGIYCLVLGHLDFNLFKNKSFFSLMDDCKMVMKYKKVNTGNELLKQVVLQDMSNVFALKLCGVNEMSLKELLNNEIPFDTYSRMYISVLDEFDRVNVDSDTIKNWILKSRLTNQEFNMLCQEFVTMPVKEAYKKFCTQLKDKYLDFFDFMIAFSNQDFKNRLIKTRKPYHLYSYNINNYVFYAVSLPNGGFIDLNTMKTVAPEKFLYQTITIPEEQQLYDTNVTCNFIKGL